MPSGMPAGLKTLPCRTSKPGVVPGLGNALVLRMFKATALGR